MKLATASILVLSAALTADAVKLEELHNSLQSALQAAQVATEQRVLLTIDPVDPLELEACANGDLTCEAGNLQMKVEYATEMTEVLSSPLDTVKSALTDVESVKTGMTTLKTTFTLIKTAVAIAANLPAVGVAFKALKVLVEGATTGIEKIEKSIDTVYNNLIKPWTKSIDDLSSAFADLPDKFFSIVQSAAGFGGALPEMCLKETLATVMSGLGPTLNGVESSVATLNLKLDNMISKLDNVKNALLSSQWATVQSTLKNVVDGLNALKTAGEKLKPLDTALNTQISIPWVSGVRTRHNEGNPSHCPPGKTDLVDIFCFTPCPDGMERSGILSLSNYKCRTKCDHGMIEIASLKYCLNPSKLTPAGMPYKPGFCKDCNAGDVLNGLGKCDPFKTCTPTCKDGKVNAGNMMCTDPCSGGGTSSSFGIPPLITNLCSTKSIDFPKSAMASATCSPGYKMEGAFVGPGCMEICRAGETEVGALCVAKAERRISLKDVMNEVSKILDLIRGLPVYSEIENAIGNLARPALKGITDILSDLGLPTEANLPKLDVNFANLGALPVKDLAAALSDLTLPPSISLTNLKKIPAALDDLVNSFASKANLPPTWKACEDMNCLAPLVGLNGVDFTKLTDELAKVQSTAAAVLQAGLGTNPRCTKSQVMSVSVTDKVAKALGLSASQVNPCNIDLTVCKEFSIDKAVMQDALNRAADNFKPLGKLVKQIYANQPARLLQESTSGSLIDNVWLPVLMVPIGALVQNVDFTRGTWPTASSFLFKATPGTPPGTFVRVNPYGYVFMMMRFNTRNGAALETSIKSAVGAKIVGWKGEQPREVLVNALRTLDEEMGKLESESNKCVLRSFQTVKGEDRGLYVTKRQAFSFEFDQKRITCKKLSKKFKKLDDVTGWKYNTIGSRPVDQAAATPDQNAFWDNPNVKKDVARLVGWLFPQMNHFIAIRQAAQYELITGTKLGKIKLADRAIPLPLIFPSNGGPPSLNGFLSDGWHIGPVLGIGATKSEVNLKISLSTGKVEQMVLWLPTLDSFSNRLFKMGWFSNIFDVTRKRVGTGIMVTYTADNYHSARITPNNSPALTLSPTTAP